MPEKTFFEMRIVGIHFAGLDTTSCALAFFLEPKG